MLTSCMCQDNARSTVSGSAQQGRGCDGRETFRQALAGRFDIPDHVSPVAADLISGLLQVPSLAESCTCCARSAAHAMQNSLQSCASPPMSSASTAAAWLIAGESGCHSPPPVSYRALHMLCNTLAAHAMQDGSCASFSMSTHRLTLHG